MPDETKLALTDCASHGLVKPVTFQAVRHCFLLLACAFRMPKTKRIVTNDSIERRLRSGIQRGGTMIRRLRALGRVARCDPATALVRRKPRSQAGLVSQSSSR